MPLQQRVLLVICAAFLFVYVVRRIRKKKLQIADAVFWVLFLLLVLLMAVVPEITFLCAALLGFSSPSNFVFLAVIGLLILKVFSNSVEISVLRHKVEELSQEVALFHKDEINGAEKQGR